MVVDCFSPMTAHKRPSKLVRNNYDCYEIVRIETGNSLADNTLMYYHRTEVELGIFTPGENVEITPYHGPIIKYSSREFFF
jgi:hypothetical protein